MAFRFESSETIPDGIRRLFAEQAALAVDHLATFRRPARDVHEARKSIKKLRAILRLCRPQIRKSARRRLQLQLRATARELGPQRESLIRLRMLDGLLQVHPDRSEELASLRRQWQSEHWRRVQCCRRDPDWCHRLPLRIRSSSEFWAELDFEDGIEAFANAMERMLRDSARGFRRALRKPTTKRLHDWRKRLKDHWYLTRMFESCWPGSPDLDGIQDRLGRDHDLADFRSALDTTEALSPPVRKFLDEVISEQRSCLQAAAFEQASALYGDEQVTAGAVVTAWTRWRSQSK